jgi:dihydrofolate reductase
MTPMGKIVLWMQMSLDGRAAGPNGELDWPVVEDEVHRYFNETLRDVDTFMYGRKVYEGMAAFWPTADEDPEGAPRHAEYARIWKPMPKIVFSRTLENPEWNTRVSGDVAGEVAELKDGGDGTHVLFGGPEIVSRFLELDLIDDYRLFVHPVALGSGPALLDGVPERRNLRLVEARTFDSAVVHVHYERV